MTTKPNKAADEAPKDDEKAADKQEKSERQQVEESPVTIAERSMPQPVEEKDLPEQTAFQE